MKRHVAWNLGGTVAATIIALLSVPAFLYFYGAERYGILATVWVVLGYFSVFDFGMGQAVVHALAQAEKGDRGEPRVIWWTALLLNFTIGMVIAVAVAVVVMAVGLEQMTGSGRLSRELWSSLPLVLLMMPLALVFPILIGTFDAQQRFAAANGHQVVASILFQGLPLLAALWIEPTLPVAIAASLVGRALSCLMLFAQSVGKFGYWPPRFERTLIGRLGGFGGWIALSSGAGVLLDTADRLVITSFLGGAPAAWYAIAHSAVIRVRSLPLALLRTLFPRISADEVGSAAEVATGVRALSLVLVPVISLAIFAVDPLFRVWVGASAAARAVPLAQAMLPGLFANCLAFMPLVAIQAGGNPRRSAMIHLFETPIFLSLMIFSVIQYGLLGAAVVLSLRMYADSVLLFWAAGMRSAFLREGLIQSLLPLTCCVIAFAMPGTWVERAAVGTGLLIVWAVADTVVARRGGHPLDLLHVAAFLRRRRTAAASAP